MVCPVTLRLPNVGFEDENHKNTKLNLTLRIFKVCKKNKNKTYFGNLMCVCVYVY